MNDTLLISISGDVLVIGRKRPNESVEIVNAFQGEEAKELYSKLVAKQVNTNAEVSE